MEDLRDRLTILAISHQAALVESADRVYRLHEGGVSLQEKREPD
jgi:ABC-type transport system involved in cytochrome bd biosynthesis fused ATPase/permease subunit